MFESNPIPRFLKLNAIALFLVFLSSCGDDQTTPKKYGYPRIDLPKQSYVLLDQGFPFSFDVSQAAKVERVPAKDPNDVWLNVTYPTLNGQIHLSYKQLTGKAMLQEAMEDAYIFTSKHHSKANGIKEQDIHRNDAHVHGLLYSVGGNAASPMQFWVTDSTKHFIRGAIYFNSEPNADSLQPATDFLAKDLFQLIGTMKWK